MPEPGLNLSFTDIQSEVGFVLGYGSTSSSWSTNQTAAVARYMLAGQRQAYAPPPMGDGRAPHCWSFLRPVFQMPTVSARGDYQMPPGTTRIEDPITFAVGENYGKIRITSYSHILSLRESDTNGRPQYACLLPAQPNMITTQRWTLSFWPVPDAVYNLSMRAEITPIPLSADYPYPPGSAAFGEYLKECCLAKAEATLEDTQAIHAAEMMKWLAIAVYQDRKSSSESVLGYNSDPSMTWGSQRGIEHGYHLVEVNGVAPA